MALSVCTGARTPAIVGRSRTAASRRLQSPKPVPCQAAADSAPKAPKQPIDFQEIGKLMGATAVEVSAISAGFLAIDQISGFMPDFVPAKAAVWLLLLGMSFRSQVVSPLNAKRPSATKDGPEGKGFADRKRPSWCPPGPVFGIVWSTMAVLRATSGTIVWQACGQQLFCLPLLVYALHLSIGDTWNYINNKQQKMGVAATVITSGVWTSAACLAAVYYKTVPTAGLIILPLCIWLTIATALVWSIWDLNGREDLLPRMGIEDEKAAAVAALIEKENQALYK